MSRKEKEVVVRLSEADLRAVGYIRDFLGVDDEVDGEKKATQREGRSEKSSSLD